MASAAAPKAATAEIPGGVADEDEARALDELDRWAAGRGLPNGVMLHEVSDPDTGEPRAVFDPAWPDGLQPGLGRPVAALLNESAELFALANGLGYRGFSSTQTFREYVEEELPLSD